MARPLRLEFPGAVYHLTSRGNEKRPIFHSDADRETFLVLLGLAAKRFGWSITAFVLMTNHFHLVIQTRYANLSRGMHWLNGTYAGRFNKRHDRWGHLFGGRFKAYLIEKESYLTEVLRYVVLNPVAAKMVERPEDYRWSSYRATAGLEAAPEWLDVNAALREFAPVPELARTLYRAWVSETIGCEERLWDRAINGLYLGSEAWARKMRKVVESKPRSTDHPRTQRAIGRPKISRVVQIVARVAGVKASEIRNRRGGALRRLAAWIGWNEGWLTLRSIAAGLRLSSQGHVSGLIRRCEVELGSDRTLLKQLDAAIAKIRA